MTDDEFLARIDGLYVGQLTKLEMVRFIRLMAEGRASRSYNGVAGVLGVATVKRTQEVAE